MNETIKRVLKEPSTWAGIAAVLLAAFNLDAMSAEQLSVILAGIAAVFLPESK